MERFFLGFAFIFTLLFAPLSHHSHLSLLPLLRKKLEKGSFGI